ncbi:MAG: xanthine dehydrogenase family protein molybdopterin-binding subunit [Novosphingobium sp.]|nr:xanthine dehydrogenase family protein molybdopterin-binding subunit [Novosphingobium sp.]
MNAPGGIGAARYIGERMPRKEDGRLLTGRGTYVDDVVVPGMLHVAFARSPMARGRIVSIDTTMAKAMPGVHAVLTEADLARIPVTLLSFFMMPMEVETTLLARDRVAYVGDPVALIVATDRYLAEDAAGAVMVEYDEETPVVTIADARAAPPIHPDAASNVAATMGEDEPNPDLERALRGAAHVVERTLTHQRISQSPMETRGVVSAPQGDEELTLYITCQSPSVIARSVALSLGMPDLSIRVIAKDVGGSFGLKNTPWREELAVIAASLILQRPLKWIEDRLENLISANQAREQEMTLRIGFDAEGKLVASHCDYGINNGAYPQGADANVAVHAFLWAAYKMPAYGFLTRGWYTNTVGLAAYRGPWAMESYGREVLLDIAAREMGIDPIEIRRKNLVTRADQPCMTAFGMPLEDITPADCLEKLLRHFDVGAFRAEQAEARKAGRYLGLGFAVYIEPTGTAGSMPVMTGETVSVRIEPNGKVQAMLGTHSQGHGTATTMAQVIAEELGVRYEDVNVFEGDSSRGGYGPGAAGSRQGVIGGGAAVKAASLLRDKVKQVAAHVLNASPDAVTLERGTIRVAGAEEMTRSLREIAEIAYGEPARLPHGVGTGLEVTYRYDPPPVTFTSAAHAAIVEVDGDTGFVKIKRWISSEDCGVMINPAVVEGQIAGGLAQAIGTVLLEEFHYDERGNPTTATYKDYLLPTIFDVPDFEYVHANTPSQAAGGFRGVGEGGAIIGPPTLVNAIADALAPFGEIPLDLPLTPAKLLAVITGKPLSPQHHAAHPAAAAGDAAAPAPTPDDPGIAAVLAGVEPERIDPPTAAGAAVDGTWKLVMATPMGPQEMTARFATDGTTLMGALESPEGSQEFAGTAEGPNLRWEMKVTKPMPVTLKYDLTVTGDTLAGKCKMGMFGSAKVSGERA